MDLGVPPGVLRVPATSAPWGGAGVKRLNPDRIPAWVWRSFAAGGHPQAVLAWRDDTVKLSGLLQGGKMICWNHRTYAEGVARWQTPDPAAGHAGLYIRRKGSEKPHLLLLEAPGSEVAAVAWLRRAADRIRHLFPDGVSYPDDGAVAPSTTTPPHP